MKQKTVFLICGIPASGKSTWARAHMTPTTEWISRDKVRFSIVREDEEYFSHEDEVFDTFIAYINQTLENPEVDTIFIDATHISKGARRKVLSRMRNQNITDRIRIASLVSKPCSHHALKLVFDLCRNILFFHLLLFFIHQIKKFFF